MKAVILTDAAGYRYKDGDDERVAYATRGEEVELSESEFKRLSEAGAVAKSGSKEAKAAMAAVASASEPRPGVNLDPAGAPVDRERTDNEFVEAARRVRGAAVAEGDMLTDEEREPESSESPERQTQKPKPE